MPATYFFFGTLMDEDVRHLVLGRRHRTTAYRPARLDGFRRVRVRGESYPMLIADTTATVDGIVMSGLDVIDAERIAWYEGGDYVIEYRTVWPRQGNAITARIFAATAALQHDDEPWDYRTWQQRDKPDALALTTAWMALAGKVTDSATLAFPGMS